MPYRGKCILVTKTVTIFTLKMTFIDFWKKKKPQEWGIFRQFDAKESPRNRRVFSCQFDLFDDIKTKASQANELLALVRYQQTNIFDSEFR